MDQNTYLKQKRNAESNSLTNILFNMKFPLLKTFIRKVKIKFIS